jgi:predicted Zn-dependent protease
MFEVDLNNGMFREIDLDKPVYCSKCGKEIKRGTRNSINLEIDVHFCGYAFCKKCKKKLNDFAVERLTKYEKKLVDAFIKD